MSFQPKTKTINTRMYIYSDFEIVSCVTIDDKKGEKPRTVARRDKRARERGGRAAMTTTHEIRTSRAHRGSVNSHMRGENQSD